MRMRRPVVSRASYSTLLTLTRCVVKMIVSPRFRYGALILPQYHLFWLYGQICFLGEINTGSPGRWISPSEKIPEETQLPAKSQEKITIERMETNPRFLHKPGILPDMKSIRPEPKKSRGM